MTRTELLALADALEKCNPCRNSASVYQAADFLRQIAQAQPVAWGDGFSSFISADEKVRYAGDPDIAEYQAALYNLPLED